MIVCDIIRPILELMVVIPGMILAYLPVKSYMKQPLGRIVSWMLPLLLGACVICGGISYRLNDSVGILLLLVAASAMVIYHRTLKISLWKSVSILLAVSAVFACVNSISRAVNAKLTADLNITQNEPWFCLKAEIFYNAMCWLFVLLAWYPASHAARTMIADDNFAQTWYIFWIVPSIFIVLNIFMVPTYRSTLYTGRILAGYVVISLVLLAILVLFYAMFLAMANGLNRNARLQQENHSLSLQKERYANLQTAIEETRQARHDMRHHFLRLSSMAERGDLDEIKKYLSNMMEKMSGMSLHFCENQAADSIISHYAALAAKEEISFKAAIELPAEIPTDEIDLCLVLSNLLENAVEASIRTEKSRRKINLEVRLHHTHLILIQVENAFSGQIQEKNEVFQSSKRDGNGIGIESVRRISEKNGGSSSFQYKNGIFTAKIILRTESA